MKATIPEYHKLTLLINAAYALINASDGATDEFKFNREKRQLLKAVEAVEKLLPY